jgi:hypothetical protein
MMTPRQQFADAAFTDQTSNRFQLEHLYQVLPKADIVQAPARNANSLAVFRPPIYESLSGTFLPKINVLYHDGRCRLVARINKCSVVDVMTKVKWFK